MQSTIYFAKYEMHRFIFQGMDDLLEEVPYLR